MSDNTQFLDTFFKEFNGIKTSFVKAQPSVDKDTYFDIIAAKTINDLIEKVKATQVVAYGDKIKHIFFTFYYVNFEIKKYDGKSENYDIENVEVIKECFDFFNSDDYGNMGKFTDIFLNDRIKEINKQKYKNTYIIKQSLIPLPLNYPVINYGESKDEYKTRRNAHRMDFIKKYENTDNPGKYLGIIKKKDNNFNITIENSLYTNLCENTTNDDFNMEKLSEAQEIFSDTIFSEDFYIDLITKVDAAHESDQNLKKATQNLKEIEKAVKEKVSELKNESMGTMVNVLKTKLHDLTAQSKDQLGMIDEDDQQNQRLTTFQNKLIETMKELQEKHKELVEKKFDQLSTHVKHNIEELANGAKYNQSLNEINEMKEQNEAERDTNKKNAAEREMKNIEHKVKNDVEKLKMDAQTAQLIKEKNTLFSTCKELAGEYHKLVPDSIQNYINTDAELGRQLDTLQKIANGSEDALETILSIQFGVDRPFAAIDHHTRVINMDINSKAFSKSQKQFKLNNDIIQQIRNKMNKSDSKNALQKIEMEVKHKLEELPQKAEIEIVNADKIKTNEQKDKEIAELNIKYDSLLADHALEKIRFAVEQEIESLKQNAEIKVQEQNTNIEKNNKEMIEGATKSLSIIETNVKEKIRDLAEEAKIKNAFEEGRKDEAKNMTVRMNIEKANSAFSKLEERVKDEMKKLKEVSLLHIQIEKLKKLKELQLLKNKVDIEMFKMFEKTKETKETKEIEQKFFDGINFNSNNDIPDDQRLLKYIIRMSEYIKKQTWDDMNKSIDIISGNNEIIQIMKYKRFQELLEYATELINGICVEYYDDYKKLYNTNNYARGEVSNKLSPYYLDITNSCFKSAKVNRNDLFTGLADFNEIFNISDDVFTDSSFFVICEDIHFQAELYKFQRYFDKWVIENTQRDMKKSLEKIEEIVKSFHTLLETNKDYLGLTDQDIERLKNENQFPEDIQEKIENKINEDEGSNYKMAQEYKSKLTEIYNNFYIKPNEKNLEIGELKENDLPLVEQNKELMKYIEYSNIKQKNFALSVGEYKEVNDILLNDIEKTSLEYIIGLVNNGEMYDNETSLKNFLENPVVNSKDVKRKINKLSKNKKNAKDNRILAILTKWLQIYTMQNTNETINKLQNTIAEKQISLQKLKKARMSDEDLQKLTEYISHSRDIKIQEPEMSRDFFEDLDLNDIAKMCIENNEVCLYILRIGENQIDTIYDEAKNNSKNIEDEIKYIMKIFNELFNYAVGIPINEPVLASYFQNFINYFKGGVKYDKNVSPNLFEYSNIATNDNTGIVDFMHNITRFFFIDLQGIDKSEKINWKDTIEYPYKLNDFKDTYLQFQINWFENIYDSKTTSDVVKQPTQTAYTHNLIHIIDFIGIYNQAKIVLDNAIQNSNGKIAKKIIIFMYKYIENYLKQNSAYKMLKHIVNDNNILSTFKKWEYSQMHLKYATTIDEKPENLRIYDVIKNINMSKIMTLVRINNFDHNGNPTIDWNKARFLPYINGNKDRMMLSYNNDNIQYYANDVNLRRDIKDDSDNGLTNEQGFTDKFIKKYKHYLFGNFNKIFPSDMKAKDGVSINKTISQDKDTFQRLYNQLYANKIVFVLGYGSSGAGKTSSLIHNKSVKKNKDGIMVEFINGMSPDYDEIDFTSIEMAGKRSIINNKETYVMHCLKNGEESEESDDKKNYKATFERNQDDNCFILTPPKPQSVSKPQSASKSRSSTSTSQGKRTKQDSSDKEDIENQKTIGDVLFERVDKNRKVHSTMNNPNSSRSHVICILKFKKKLQDSSEDSSEDNPILVIGDLAGVENKFDNNNAGIVHRFVNQFELKKSIEGRWRKGGNDKFGVSENHIKGFHKHYNSTINLKKDEFHKPKFIKYEGNKEDIIDFFAEKLVKVKQGVINNYKETTEIDNYKDKFITTDNNDYKESFKTLIETMITTDNNNNMYTLNKFKRLRENLPNTEFIDGDYDMFDKSRSDFTAFEKIISDLVGINRATIYKDHILKSLEDKNLREYIIKIANFFGYKTGEISKDFVYKQSQNKSFNPNMFLTDETNNYKTLINSDNLRSNILRELRKMLDSRNITYDQFKIHFFEQIDTIVKYLINGIYDRIEKCRDAPNKPNVKIKDGLNIQNAFDIENNDDSNEIIIDSYMVMFEGDERDRRKAISNYSIQTAIRHVTQLNEVILEHKKKVDTFIDSYNIKASLTDEDKQFNSDLLTRIELIQRAWIWAQHGRHHNKLYEKESKSRGKMKELETKIKENKNMGDYGLKLFMSARKIPICVMKTHKNDLKLLIHDIMLFFAAGVGEEYKEKMYFIKDKYRKTKLLSNAEIYADVTQLRNNVNDYIDHVLWVQSVIPNRTAEGMYINDDLRYLREDILNCMIEKTKGYIFTSPLYHDVCKSSFCNTETKKCFAMKSEISENENKLENISAKSFIMENLFKNIYEYPTTASLTDFYNKLQITIFTVFNIRKGANNPPPQVYLDINDLNMNYHSNEVIDPDTLDGIVNGLEPIIYQIETNPNLQLLKDPLEIYKKKIKQDKSKATFNFLKEIDNHNAISTMGTLFFTDNMSKYGTTQNVCTILDKDIKASSYTINDFNTDLSFPKEVIEIGKDEKFDIVHKGDTQIGVPRVKQDGKLSNSLKATIGIKQEQQEQHILPKILNQAALIKNVRELTIENESFDNIETQPKMIDNLETKRVALKNILNKYKIKLNNKMFDKYIYNKHEYLDIKDDEKDAEKIRENIETIKKNIEMNNDIVQFIREYDSNQNRLEILPSLIKDDNTDIDTVVGDGFVDALGNEKDT